MRLITSHIGADFDSLASMVAAQKLYGGGTLSFSGASSRNVRDFLKRYSDRWQVLTPRRIDFDAVDSLVLVDVRGLSRIGPFRVIAERPGVQVHLYDHHPPVIDEIKANRSLIESVGSTTTLLVELLLANHIPIAPPEATLFSLGIYEDTGALTFGATTERDYEAAAKLRLYGADLTLIPSYIELSYSVLERQILDRLMENAWERYIHGVKVVLSTLIFPYYVEGLSLFVHRMRDTFDADVALAVVSMAKRTYVVMRSREQILDASQFLKPIGGGGHPQAASATLSLCEPSSVISALEKELERAIHPVLRVRDVMSSPVIAIDPKLSIEEAYRIMLRYGHGALPVVSNEKLVGLVTRKDLDKAKLHGLDKTAVEEFMTRGVITVSPDASISEAHRQMALRNIGRLVVVEGERPVGIVTRTDMLRALYPISLPPGERALGESLYPWVEPVGHLLEERLHPWMLELLERLGARAEKLGMRAYAVGGFVRDLLLARSNLDLDVVIEGDGVQFVNSWKEDGCHISVHQRFQTGTIVFPDGHKVDVATARREFYEYPTAQPNVSSDSLKHDLYRRDFTINAMAISINPSQWGKLVDYFGGRRDLKRRILRILHNLSFVEDPTRVLRGIRLCQRLGFEIEENTLRLMKSCIRGGLLTLLSGVKLKSELELILLEREVHPIVEKLVELKVLDQIFPGFKWGLGADRCVRRIFLMTRRLERDLPDFGKEIWLAYLGALLLETPEPTVRSILDRLSLTPRERLVVEKGLFELGIAENALGGRGEKRHSEIFLFLRDYEDVTLLLWAAATKRWRLRRRILLYLTRLEKVVPMLTGRDLLELGIPRGPLIGRVLESLRLARLDGEVETREEEEGWVKMKSTSLEKV